MAGSETSVEDKGQRGDARHGGPTDPSAITRLARTHFLNGDVEEAISVLERGIEAAPSSAEMRWNLGSVYYRAGRYTEAVAQLEAAATLYGTSAQAYCDLGTAAQAAGMIDRTRAAYQHALEIDPSFEPARTAMLNLSDAAGGTGQATTAIGPRPWADASPVDVGTKPLPPRLHDASANVLCHLCGKENERHRKYCWNCMAPIETDESVSSGVGRKGRALLQPASFFSRLNAQFIDWAITYTVATVLAVPVLALVRRRVSAIVELEQRLAELTDAADNLVPGSPEAETYLAALGQLAAIYVGVFLGCLIIVGAVYYVASNVRTGQTIGKSRLRLLVTTTDGSPLTFGRAVLRYLGRCLSWLTFGVGFLIAAPNNGRALLDIIAGTKVMQLDKGA